MERNFKIWLFASVALGCLGADSLAMPEDEFPLSTALKIRENQQTINFDHTELELQDFYLSYNSQKNIWNLSHEAPQTGEGSSLTFGPNILTIEPSAIQPPLQQQAFLAVTPIEYGLIHFFRRKDDQESLSQILKRETWSQLAITKFRYQSNDVEKEFTVFSCPFGKLRHHLKMPIFKNIDEGHITEASVKPWVKIGKSDCVIESETILKTSRHRKVSTSSESTDPQHRFYQNGLTYFGKSKIQEQWQRELPVDDPEGWKGMDIGSYSIFIPQSKPYNQKVVHTWVKTEDNNPAQTGEYESMADQPLGAPYIYSDGENIYLTKCIEEKWKKDKQISLVRLISHTDHKLILNESTLFSKALPQGVYTNVYQTANHEGRKVCWKKLLDTSNELDGFSYWMHFPYHSSSWVKEISPSLPTTTDFITGELGELEALPILSFTFQNNKNDFPVFRDSVYPHLTNLVELSLSSIKKLDDLDWANQRLVSLSLMSSTLWDSACSNIKKLTNLTSLNLAYSTYNFAKLLNSISTNFTQLAYLNLSGQSIGNNAHNIGRMFHQLISLILNNTSDKTKNTDIENLLNEQNSKNTNLRELSLVSNDLEDTEISTIHSMFTNLISLNLSKNYISDTGATELAENLTDLTKLDLSSNKIGSMGANNIVAHLKKLSFLKLNNNNIGLSALLSLIKRFRWSSLEMIDNNEDLKNGILLLKNPDDIKTYKKLISISRGVSVNNPNKDILKEININMSHLESLSLLNKSEPFSKDDVAKLLAMKNLTELNFAEGKINNEAVVELFNNGKKIKALSLFNMGIKEIKISNLLPKLLLNLTSLDLNDNDLDIEFSHLLSLKNLIKLSAGGNNLKFAGLEKLVKSNSFTALTHLDLHGNSSRFNIDEKNFTTLVPSCTNLTFLDLSYNKIYDNGINILATRLSKLVELHLYWTWTNDGGVKDIAANLKSLEILNLGYTNVAWTGVEALTKLSSLRCLDLSNNNRPKNNYLNSKDEELKKLFSGINNLNLVLQRNSK